MEIEEIILKLECNDNTRCEEAVRLLIKIADNVIENPTNVKVRTLKKNNPTISGKILSVNGALDCLKLMGFVENHSDLTLPENITIKHVKDIKERVLQRKNCQIVRVQNGATPTQETIKPVVLPPLKHYCTNEFLRRIELCFHSTLSYKDVSLLERTKKLVPIDNLIINATNRLRNLQESIKNGAVVDLDVSLQDMLLLEVLDWFKNDFFTWVDCPKCEQCGSTTKFSHMNEDQTLMIYTNRIEMYKCENCANLTPFPRYNDLNVLLETRRGRCGEWANVFTLICIALGWEARQVFCETDHVWTEVYSQTQKRWLHCDSCENICDNPLMYEIGWGKKLSYVIAYGLEDVQDVTWRYSSKHKEVLTRRTKCDETELIKALIEMRNRRHEQLTLSRKSYLIKRILYELAEFLIEKKPTKDSQQGRISGSLNWRLARNEIKLNRKPEMFLFNNVNEMSETSIVTIKYSPVCDAYVKEIDGVTKERYEKWNGKLQERESVFRKEEHDWKTVYLCRDEGATIGTISWLFKIDDDTSKQFKSMKLAFNYKTFENGVVDVEVIFDDVTRMKFDKDQKTLHATNIPDNCKTIAIVAKLSGGNGSLAWQHAQLFRQNMDDTLNYPFIVNFQFK